MDLMLETLKEGLPRLGLELGDEICVQLCDFGRAMVKQNEVMNLTGITEDAPVAKLHLLDSLTVLACADLKGKRIIDVGCGAGFPGVPLAIACPEARVTLLDSLAKRMNWLETVLPQVGIKNAECITARAEEAVSTRRESYDFATSRAVARLNMLLELTAPYVKVGGKFLALKGAMTREEVDEAKNAITTLGGRVAEIREFPIADAIHRIVVIEKIRPTPKQYPRKFAKIKQSPL